MGHTGRERNWVIQEDQWGWPVMHLSCPWTRACKQPMHQWVSPPGAVGSSNDELYYLVHKALNGSVESAPCYLTYCKRKLFPSTDGFTIGYIVSNCVLPPWGWTVTWDWSTDNSSTKASSLWCKSFSTAESVMANSDRPTWFELGYNLWVCSNLFKSRWFSAKLCQCQ